MRHRRPAFTLVELLVVIGIIAVLVGILLPVLGKSRAQAQTVKCSANLHSIGLGIMMYANTFRGTLPYGYWDGSSPPAGAAANGNSSDWAILLLSSVYHKGFGNYGSQNATDTDNTIQSLFVCPSAVLGAVPGSITRKLHYSCHPRLMPNLAEPDLSIPGTPQAMLRPRKLSSIARSQEVALIWDAGLVADFGYNAPAVCKWLDQYGLYRAPGYTENGRNWNFLLEGPQVTMGQAIYCANQDYQPGASIDTDLRFRHGGGLNGKNSGCNLLFVDGHCETFKLKQNSNSDAKLKNFYVNPHN